MQAIILAAGAGTRIGSSEGGMPKCLLQVGGKPLIRHQIESLRRAGIESIVTVIGYEQRQIRHALAGTSCFVVNERFAETNSMYSFLLARDYVDGDVVVLNCDVLFDPAILSRLLQAGGNSLTYDSSSGGESEHMKIALRDGWLLEMSKNLPREHSRGENLGMLLLGRRAANDAFDAAERIVAQGRQRDWLASAINEAARMNPFRCVDVTGLPWVEIDFPSDLIRAQQEIWPAIEARAAMEAERVLVGAVARSLPPHDRRVRVDGRGWLRRRPQAPPAAAVVSAA